MALGVRLSPQTTSFHHTITSALPLSVYHSPPHQSSTVQPNTTGSISHTTTLQTTDQHWVTTAPASHMTTQAGANTSKAHGQTSSTAVTTTAADTAAAGQATTQAMETVTQAVKNVTVPPYNQITTHVDTVTNTTIENTTSKTQTTTTATNTTATTSSTVKPTTSSTNHTTSGSSTATTMTNATTTHQGTHTTIPSTTMMVRPTLAPQPSPIPTGTYIISSSNKTCIKAVMGLQLMALSTQKVRWKHYEAKPYRDYFFTCWNMFYSFKSNLQKLSCMIKITGLLLVWSLFFVPKHFNCSTLVHIMMSEGHIGTFLFQQFICGSNIEEGRLGSSVICVISLSQNGRLVKIWSDISEGFKIASFNEVNK